MKAVGKTEAIRIYPMKDSTYGIMWKIHSPESALNEFKAEDWAKNERELTEKLTKLGEFMSSKK